MVGKNMKNMQQHTMYAWCEHTDKLRLINTDTGNIVSENKSYFFYYESMPLEDYVILLEYPQ